VLSGGIVRHLFAALVCVLSFSANAEWTKTSAGIEDGKPWEQFVDLEAIQRDQKHWFKIWTMIDFPKGREGTLAVNQWLPLPKQINSDTPWSAVFLDKYYCSTRLIERIYTDTFAGSMGKGRSLVQNTNQAAAIPIVPQSIEDQVLRTYCLK